LQYVKPKELEIKIMKNQVMWEKPQKIMTTEEWKSISADGAPAGVYTPNMSMKDMLKWKGTLKGKTTKNPYVELRKTYTKTNNKSYPNNKTTYAQVLIVVSYNNEMKDANIIMSMNGKTAMSFQELEELRHAVLEAQLVLKKLK
jgi:hypothetical protein